MRMNFNYLKILLLGSIIFAAPLATAQEKDKVILLLNWYNYGEHAPFYLGLVRGYYAAEKIDLEIKEGKGSGVTVKAIASGEATFGYADTGTMMKGIIKDGSPVKSVGILLQRSPMAVMGFADKDIVKPADIVGKTVAVTPGDALSQLWPVFLAKNGIKEDQFKTFSGNANEKRLAVINGQADLLLGNINDQKPLIQDSTNKIVRGILFADYGVNPISAGVIVHTDLMTKNPDLIRRFMKASIKAVEETSVNPDAAIVAMLKVNPKAGSTRLLRDSLSLTLPLYHTKETEKDIPFKVNPKDVETTLDLMIQYGGVDATKRGSPSDYYTAEFLPGKKRRSFFW